MSTHYICIVTFSRSSWKRNGPAVKFKHCKHQRIHPSVASALSQPRAKHLFEGSGRAPGSVWLTPPTKRQFKQAALKGGPLDREHSVLGRVEQSYLRHVLFNGAEHAACSMCGRRLPLGLRIAAHIKPRSECSHAERLDAENIVFGLCLLGFDALYERGLISVGDGGRRAELL